MYEASEMIALGAAEEVILGVKPVYPEIESEGEVNRTERINDIDETED